MADDVTSIALTILVCTAPLIAKAAAPTSQPRRVASKILRNILSTNIFRRFTGRPHPGKVGHQRLNFGGEPHRVHAGQSRPGDEGAVGGA